MEKVAGIDRDAALPKYHGKTFAMRPRKRERRRVNQRRPPSAARRCSTPPASSTTTTRDRRGGARACWPATASRPRWPIPPAAACRSWSRARSQTVAGSGARRSPAELLPVDRQGLRHDRAGAVLRPDAEVRMAADPARRSRRCKRLSQATFDISEYVVDIAKQGRPGARPAADRRRRHACTSPAMPARRTWGQGGRDAAPDPETRGRGRSSAAPAMAASWGVMKENFEIALKVGRPVARQAA